MYSKKGRRIALIIFIIVALTMILSGLAQGFLFF
ncbi:MAG: hypothetical protein UX35_C0013G0024 [Microgenomates group bacterium GW2011_GWA1_46_15]|nr:MAG: hypothetical protein UX00_C0003G0096 [Microgenomates group bacterium GW2011_GWB1_45_17]KKU22947.1 MAG: hypothetical protein UX35_C0013G0024 [Microgenomates group bacterium GW2011_GWA1_46_15]KKU24099.1 MAG: hypothetical protein UX36_C0002G0082 [Microgenomates group bacterium GW2011_GWC1_46_15]